jgi:AcrR family transcriptional regulator
MARGRPREFDTDAALEAALRLFWRHGYEGTSLAALTQAMGINVPSLYAAFGNKEALFAAVLQKYLHSQACYLPNALKEPSARQAVQTLFKGAIDMAMNQRHPTGCMLVQGALATGPGGEPARAALSKTRAAAEAAVRRRFDRAKADGDLPPHVNAAKLARYIMAVVWGISVQAAGGASRAALKDVAELAMAAWPK